MTRLALLKVSKYIRGQAEVKSTTKWLPRVSARALGEKYELTRNLSNPVFYVARAKTVSNQYFILFRAREIFTLRALEDI